jgi:hypothetical protein
MSLQRMKKHAPSWIVMSAALPLAAHAHSDHAPHIHLSETFALPYAVAVPGALLCVALGLWLFTRRQAWSMLAGTGTLAAGAALLLNAR